MRRIFFHFTIVATSLLHFMHQRYKTKSTREVDHKHSKINQKTYVGEIRIKSNARKLSNTKKYCFILYYYTKLSTKSLTMITHFL